METSINISGDVHSADTVGAVDAIGSADTVDDHAPGSGTTETPGKTADDMTATTVDALTGHKGVDKSAPANAGSRPVPLYHAMKLEANQPLQLYAKKRLEVAPGVFVWSDTPFFVEVAKPTMLKGCEVLDERFGKGWRSLPNELKLEILSLDPRLNGNVKRRNKKYTPGQQAGWKTLLRYRKMESELDIPPNMKNYAPIGSIAAQIFYATHHFHIEGIDYHGSGVTGMVSLKSMFFPKPDVNQWIKFLTLNVPMDRLGWSRLQCLARGEFGFDELKYLTVGIMQTVYYDSNDSTVKDYITGKPAHRKLSQYKPVVFKCEGKVTYSRDPAMLIDFDGSDELSEMDTFVREMDKILQKKITFSPDKIRATDGAYGGRV